MRPNSAGLILPASLFIHFASFIVGDCHAEGLLGVLLPLDLEP
jgi:hypothetical protein